MCIYDQNSTVQRKDVDQNRDKGALSLYIREYLMDNFHL